MTRSVDEIRLDVDRERRQLVASAQRLQGQVAHTLDVRSRLRARTLVTAAAGFLALLLLIKALKALLGAGTRLAAAKLRAVLA